MARCDYCGTGIVFGGVRSGELRFCNERCHQAGLLLAVSSQVPEDVLTRHAKEVHAGACPKCGGPGPVDVQTSYRIWSALLLTSWQSRPQISCRACGVKAKLGDAAFCALLGWWGFPWGLVVTPVQLARNLIGLAAAPNPYEPSDQLRRLLALNLAAHAVATESQQNMAS